MMNLPALWRAYRDRIDALSLRERVLIFLAAAAVMVGGLFNSLIAPVMAERTKNVSIIQTQLEQIGVWNSELESLARQKASDPTGAGKSERLSAARLQLEQLERELVQRRQQLVPPERMNRLLHSILSGQAGLKLSQFETVEASLVEGSGLQGGAAMYRHGVDLVVTGSYADVVAYLARLEKVPERIFWGNLEMTAEYPVTTLKMSLFTYSLEKSWLSL